jgi:hypothetical protein
MAVLVPDPEIEKPAPLHVARASSCNVPERLKIGSTQSLFPTDRRIAAGAPKTPLKEVDHQKITTK